jgi:hypothetical protein
VAEYDQVKLKILCTYCEEVGRRRKDDDDVDMYITVDI